MNRTAMWVVVAASVVICGNGYSRGQEPESDGAAEKAIADFELKLSDWKEILKDLRKLQTEYSATKEEDKKRELEKQWDARVIAGDQAMRTTGRAARLALEKSSAPDVKAIQFVEAVALDAVGNDDLELGAELAVPIVERMDKLNKTPSPNIVLAAAYAAGETGDFERARSYAKRYAEGEGTDAKENKQVAEIDRLVRSWVMANPMTGKTPLDVSQKAWEAEQEVRAKEAAQDDLPRVKIETTVGDLVVELFEDQAPETAGNFIYLVEKKFYDGTPFHRVIGSFMAQGGCPNGNGTGDPGYTIYCEVEKEGARKHFRGTLSMAHKGRDTGGSQFFMTFRRTDHLDGQHTAFGRVVEGLDVLAKIKKRDTDSGQPLKGDPTKIVKATVVRKRDHAYEPRRVEK